nr:cytochrome c oxidase subunit 5C-2 [Tanacetum cinerariifolium]
MGGGRVAHPVLKGPSVVKELVIGAVLGLAAGGLWKMHHWNEQRKTRAFYDLLEKGEISFEREEDGRSNWSENLQTKLMEIPCRQELQRTMESVALEEGCVAIQSQLRHWQHPVFSLSTGTRDSLLANLHLCTQQERWVAHPVLKGPSVVKELVIGAVLGLAAGGLWKMHHWNEQRKTRAFYDLLEKGEISVVVDEE